MRNWVSALQRIICVFLSLLAVLSVARAEVQNDSLRAEFRKYFSKQKKPKNMKRETSFYFDYQVARNMVQKDQTRLDFAQQYGLSEEELIVLLEYFDSVYPAVDHAMQSGDISDEGLIFIEMMNRALSKLPDYRGNTRREAKLNPKQVTKHRPGKLVIYHGFTSACAQMGLSKADDHFFVYSTHGKFIAPLATKISGEQIMFIPGTKFKILSRNDHDFILQEQQFSALTKTTKPEEKEEEEPQEPKQTEETNAGYFFQ